MKNQNIAKLQLALGTILLIMIIIGSVYAVKKVYMDNFVWSSQQILDASKHFKELNKDVDMTASGHVYQVTADIIILRTVVFTTGVLFIACMLIAMILSMILIFQGLNNVRK